MAESIYAGVMNNKELTQQLLKAQREAEAAGMSEDQMVEKACQLINAGGISDAKEEVADLLAKAAGTELSDKALDSVSGGCGCSCYDDDW